MGSAPSKRLENIPFSQLHEYISLSSSEVGAIRDRYQSYVSQKGGRSENERFDMDEAMFAKVLSIGNQKEGSYEMGGLFKLFDTNKDGVVDFRELIVGINLLHKPEAMNPSDLISIFFKLWDINADGVISPDEMSLMFEALLTSSIKFASLLTGNFGSSLDVMKKSLSSADILSELSKHESQRIDAGKRTATSVYEAFRDEKVIDDLVKLAFEEADSNKDSVISEGEFVDWVKSKDYLMEFLRNFAGVDEEAAEFAIPRFQSRIHLPGFETTLSPVWKISSAQVIWKGLEKVAPIANPYWLLSEAKTENEKDVFHCIVKGASQPKRITKPPYDSEVKESLDHFLCNYVSESAVNGTHPALYDLESYIRQIIVGNESYARSGTTAAAQGMLAKVDGIVGNLRSKYGLCEDWLLEQGGDRGCNDKIVDGYGPDLMVAVETQNEKMTIPIPVLPPIYLGPDIWNKTQWVLYTKWRYLDLLYRNKLVFAPIGDEVFKKSEVQGLLLLHLVRILLLFNKFNNWTKMELLEEVISFIAKGDSLFS